MTGSPLRQRLLLASFNIALLITTPVKAEGSFVALLGGITHNSQQDDTSPAFRILFGPRATEQLSFEMGLVDFGKVSSDISKAADGDLSSLHTRSALFSLSYRFGLTDKVGLLVKGGFNLWRADYDLVSIDASNNRTTQQESASGVSPITSTAVLWQVADTLWLRAEAETTALDSQEVQRARLRVLSLGLQYHF